MAVTMKLGPPWVPEEQSEGRFLCTRWWCSRWWFSLLVLHATGQVMWFKSKKNKSSVWKSTRKNTLYTRRLLHQAPLTPDTFYTSCLSSLSMAMHANSCESANLLFSSLGSSCSRAARHCQSSFKALITFTSSSDTPYNLLTFRGPHGVCAQSHAHGGVNMRSHNISTPCLLLNACSPRAAYTHILLHQRYVAMYKSRRDRAHSRKNTICIQIELEKLIGKT